MFQMTFTFSTIEEAEPVLACLRHAADPAAVKAAAEQIPPTDEESRLADKPKNPRGRPRRQVAEPLPEPAAPEAEVTATPEAEAEAPAQQSHTLDDVRAALKDVQAKYGTADMAKPLEILGKFGAGRVSEVKEADYAGFIAACKAA